MRLRALLLCADEKIMRVLRRVLSDLEIDIDHCPDADSAVHKLTRDHYECVIVDCQDDDTAAQVLGSARSAPRNKRAVAVAIIDGEKVVRSAFNLGAHFVLYKPISAERAKNSFRAARALMKKERRHNARVPVKIPVALVRQAGMRMKAETTDLGEGGMAIRLSQSFNSEGPVGVIFTLPGTEQVVECKGEIAWQNTGKQAGVRFVEVGAEVQERIKSWLDRNNPDEESDDPPVPGRLTDLSQGGCYMEMSAPFPARTKVVLEVQSAGKQIQVEGIVRVAHPEVGMGVEFARGTEAQKEQVETFINALMSDEEIPELMVHPEGLENSLPHRETPKPGEPADPLLDLFQFRSTLPAPEFQAELLRQRNAHTQSEGAASA
jgi:CheY-like chemotaxis protein